jgi:hypothetical protein
MEAEKEQFHTPEAGPPIGYTDLLDHEIYEKLVKEEEAKRTTPSARYHPLRPSSAGACARKLTYDLMEYRGHSYYEKTIREANVYRLLELGHSVEYSALKNFELLKSLTRIRYKQQTLSFFKLERQDKDAKPELIEGSCDAVFITNDGQWVGVIDIKSQKDGFSAFYRTRWDETLTKYNGMRSLKKISPTAWYADSLEDLLEELGDDFLCDNLYQLNMYACSNFLQERGVTFGSIIKYNKNDSRQYELRFRPSMAVYERVKNKFNRIAVAVDNKNPEAIERDSFFGSMRCAFCPFQLECWGQDAKKAWQKQLPPKAWPRDTHKMGHAGRVIEDLFLSREKLASAEKDRDAVDLKIIKALYDAQERRVRLPSGEVYEVKYLKTPKPHFELKRSKT